MSPSRPPAWQSYLELARPANVATALADVLAGFAVAGLQPVTALPFLLVATAGLYAGGVVLNDVCDRALDARERPERPIPSGRVSVRGAVLAAVLLLALGVAAAAMASTAAALVALAIVGAVVLYDIWGKHRRVFGPINMGACRGLNLWLGMVAMPGTLATHGLLGLLSVVYIAAVTVASRGEVTGGARRSITLALTSLWGVLAALTILSVAAARSATAVAGGLALTALLAWRVIPPFRAAGVDPSPAVIRRAVRAGVLSLVLLDGVIAAVYAGMIYALALLATALLAGRLARAFSVT